MIVLWGIPSEPPVRLATDAAERAGLDHVVLNQRRGADHQMWRDTASGDGQLVVEGRELALSDIDGVYVRIMDPQQLPESRDRTDVDRVDRLMAFHAMFLEWLEHAPCRVANRTGPMTSNGSKPYQSQLIRPFFDVPPTLVTNSPNEVARFEEGHGELVFKSTSSVRSIVSALDVITRSRLSHVHSLPTQFQRKEPGVDVRVHVVGDRVTAARARTDAVDYRYATREGLDVDLEQVDLPPNVEDRCVRLAAALRLPFCGIDLMARPDGTWVCFEVNPCPGYSWYESAAGVPISDMLVRWLAGP